MPDKMNDTHPNADAVQIALLRSAGQVRRSRLMLSITQSALNLSRRTVRQRYSHLSPLEQHLKFVELVYGPDLAGRLRNYLRSNQQWAGQLGLSDLLESALAEAAFSTDN